MGLIRGMDTDGEEVGYRGEITIQKTVEEKGGAEDLYYRVTISDGS